MIFDMQKKKKQKLIFEPSRLAQWAELMAPLDPTGPKVAGCADSICHSKWVS